jgi:hypothetical protein
MVLIKIIVGILAGAIGLVVGLVGGAIGLVAGLAGTVLGLVITGLVLLLVVFVPLGLLLALVL